MFIKFICSLKRGIRACVLAISGESRNIDDFVATFKFLQNNSKSC